MKHFIYFILFLCLSSFANGQTVIGDATVDVNNAAIDNSAELKIFSSTNNKGFLVPTLTTVEMNGISNPATGLLVFNETLNEFRFYNGTEWISLQDIQTVTTNSTTEMLEGETKYYQPGSYLIFLNGSSAWRRIVHDAGVITP